jgi:phosphate transport system protein
MNHTEKELLALKDEVQQMWRLTLSQVEKARQAFFAGDADIAREVLSREKRVDALELKVDSDCENYIALYSPVAVDLRLTLSLMKISMTLERIADFAEGIARHVVETQGSSHDPALLENLQMERMFQTLMSMLSDSYVALESENTRISGKILAMDDELDELYRAAFGIMTAHLTSRPDYIAMGLRLLLIIRKLERIGDHCSNLVEEIVFYVDAKVLKHGACNI